MKKGENGLRTETQRKSGRCQEEMQEGRNKRVNTRRVCVCWRGKARRGRVRERAREIEAGRDGKQPGRNGRNGWNLGRDPTP